MTKKKVGRPSKGIQTEVISFRVRKEWANDLKQTIRKLIKELKNM